MSDDLLEPPVIIDSETRLRMARGQLIRATLRWTFALLLLAMLAAGYYAWVVGDFYLLPLYAFILAGVGALVYWPRITYQVQVLVLLSLMYFAAGLNFATEGRGALGRVFLLMMTYTAVLFFGARAGIICLAISALTMLGFAWLFTNGYMVGVPDVDSTVWAGWLSNTFFILFIGLFIVLSLYYLLTNLLETLHESNELARALQAARETLEARVADRTHTAEWARQEAEAAREAIETEMWYTAGQAQLSDVMRGEQEMSQLAEGIIQHLCRYLDVPTGALFVSRNLQTLELAGQFAPGAVVRQTTFEVGEGLVGEAARHKKRLLLQQLPPDYLVVRSSLGTAVVAHLMLQPIYYAEQLLGVIELGQWRPFSARQISFLDRSVESIATTLHSARTRDYLKQLLEDSTFTG